MSKPRTRILLTVVAVCCGSAPMGSALATMPAFDRAEAALQSGKFAEAEQLFNEEVKRNPGHEGGYRGWAQALEAMGNLQGARDAWETLKLVTAIDDVQTDARRQMLRIERLLQRDQDVKPSFKDPFDVGDLEIDYAGLEEVESRDYRGIYPPFVYESPNFTVYACNEKLAKEAALVCEKVLDFLLNRMLAGRAWALRVPIFIYADKADYVSVGGHPEQSGGVAYRDHSGRTAQIAIPQNYESDMLEELGMESGVAYNLEDVLPHELTHMVINEVFGARDIPRWMNEGCARQMEQNRKDYEKAAELARDAVAGEYFKFRDLFGMEIYPTGGQVMRFYEQSATMITLILERQGPEGMRAFLTEMAAGRGHDAAVAAAFGIPEEGAIETYEKLWVEWMTQRYVNDLKRDDKEEPVVARESDSRLFKSPFDELASVASIEDWRPVTPDDPGECQGVGGPLRGWELTSKSVESKDSDTALQNMLALRMYEELPIAIQCRVRRTGGSAGSFGFAVLNDRGEEMGIQALARLTDSRAHDVTCVVGDEIAVYVDGRCTGRYPVPPRSDDVEIDYPVAMVTHAPIEVTGLKVGTIAKFEGPAAAAEDDDRGRRGRGRGRDAGRGRDRGGDDGKKAEPKKDKKKKEKKRKKPKKPKKKGGRPKSGREPGVG